MSTQAKSIQNTFGALVSHVARQWRRAANREFQPTGLTEATWVPLMHLARSSESLRQKDLAAAIGLDSSSVVRLLDELQVAGLIERREGSDRRAREIHITPQGHATVQRLEVRAVELRKRVLSNVDPVELETAFRVLTQVSETLAQAEEGVA